MKNLILKASRRCAMASVAFASAALAAQASDPVSLTVQYDDRSGHYTVCRSGTVLLADAGVEVRAGEEVLRSTGAEVARADSLRRAETFGPATVKRITFAPSAGGLRLGLEFATYQDQPWVTVRASLRNGTKKAVALDRFTLLSADIGSVKLGGPWERWRILADNCGRVVTAGKALQRPTARLHSQNVSAILDPEGGGSVLLGFSILEANGDITLRRRDAQVILSAEALMDSVLVQPGETRWSERLHIGSLPPLAGVEQYAKATGIEAGARIDGPSWASWLSWYMYNPFWDRDVTEDHVMAFAAGADRFRGELPLQAAVLDDGYQTLPGDWTMLRPLFPHGMRWLADKVKEKNLVPGLWIGLPLAHKDSALFRQHPEWVDRKADGTPQSTMGNWGGETYSLDITRKDVRKYQARLIRTITQDWGFQYLKLDFNCAPGDRRADRSVTRFQAVRNMYRLVREAAGPDVFISNCAGAPFGPAVGIAQSGRTSADVTPDWESVRDGCRQNMLRSMFHRRWWVNDPDCMMFREKDTELSLDELRTLVTTDALCGGLTQFADPLPDLPADRRRMLGQVIPSYGQSARPVDLMLSDCPRIFDLAVARPFGKWHVVGVYNWEEQPADITLDLAALGLDPGRRYHVFDFWSDTYHGLLQGIHVFKGQPAHACKALAIREEIPGQIELISTDLHITQGALEIAGMSRHVTAPFGCKAELTLTLSPNSARDGKLVFAAGDLHLAACQGAKGALARRPDGLWDVTLHDMAGQVALLLRWR